MSEPAAFHATFSDWKLIRTRKVVQLVFEVAVEEADHAYQVLGGMPHPGETIWCGIARLDASAFEVKKPVNTELAQRAGFLCTQKDFWLFLHVGDEEAAATAVRRICEVTSRSNIIPGTLASIKWQKLHEDYIEWRHNQ